MKTLLAVVNAIAFLVEIFRRWRSERRNQDLAEAISKVKTEEDTTDLNQELRK